MSSYQLPYAHILERHNQSTQLYPYLYYFSNDNISMRAGNKNNQTRLSNKSEQKILSLVLVMCALITLSTSQEYPQITWLVQKFVLILLTCYWIYILGQLRRHNKLILTSTLAVTIFNMFSIRSAEHNQNILTTIIKMIILLVLLYYMQNAFIFTSATRTIITCTYVVLFIGAAMILYLIDSNQFTNGGI